MLQMIKSGQLSHKDVIEEMINNGLLPVDVTEIGRIPISVGTIRSDPLPKRFREDVALIRLQQLKKKENTFDRLLEDNSI